MNTCPNCQHCFKPTKAIRAIKEVLDWKGRPLIRGKFQSVREAYIKYALRHFNTAECNAKLNAIGITHETVLASILTSDAYGVWFNRSLNA